MYPFKGNINGTVNSTSQNLPMLVTNFKLINKESSTIGVNVYLLSGAHQYCRMPLNTQLNAGEMFYADTPFVMLASELIKVQTSGNTDYDFTISNMVADVPDL